jgi:Zn-finger in Ran binding protein and others
MYIFPLQPLSLSLTFAESEVEARIRLPDEKDAKVTLTIKARAVQYRMMALPASEVIPESELESQGKTSSAEADQSAQKQEQDQDQGQSKTASDTTSASASAAAAATGTAATVSSGGGGDVHPIPPEAVVDLRRGVSSGGSAVTATTEGAPAPAPDTSSSTTPAAETAPASAPAPAPAPVSMDASYLPWNCPLCTFLNEPHLTRCDMCDAPRGSDSATTIEHMDETTSGASARPAGGSGRGGDAGGSYLAAATGAGWWCRSCTFINPLAERRYNIVVTVYVISCLIMMIPTLTSTHTIKI